MFSTWHLSRLAGRHLAPRLAGPPLAPRGQRSKESMGQRPSRHRLGRRHRRPLRSRRRSHRRLLQGLRVPRPRIHRRLTVHRCRHQRRLRRAPRKQGCTKHRPPHHRESQPRYHRRRRPCSQHRRMRRSRPRPRLSSQHGLYRPNRRHQSKERRRGADNRRRPFPIRCSAGAENPVPIHSCRLQQRHRRRTRCTTRKQNHRDASIGRLKGSPHHQLARGSDHSGERRRAPAPSSPRSCLIRRSERKTVRPKPPVVTGCEVSGRAAQRPVRRARTRCRHHRYPGDGLLRRHRPSRVLPCPGRHRRAVPSSARWVGRPGAPLRSRRHPRKSHMAMAGDLEGGRQHQLSGPLLTLLPRPCRTGCRPARMLAPALETRCF